MTSDHANLLYEGKAKRVFNSNHSDRVLVEFKNDATAFNARKHMQLRKKGFVNCQISACLFEVLEGEQVPNHYLGLIADTCMMAQRVQIIPLEVVVRNIAAGSLCRETPISFGQELPAPLIDLYYKDDEMGDPLLTEARLELLGLLDREQRLEISRLALKVNSVLSTFLDKLQLTLVDFKLEFGCNESGQLLVADEISPDTCRVWDQRNTDLDGRILDKDRFRKDLGGVVEAYEEILKRIQGVCSKPRIYR